MKNEIEVISRKDYERYLAEEHSDGESMLRGASKEGNKYFLRNCWAGNCNHISHNVWREVVVR